jgi:U1 small nuclear ribonucleoprotein 70kDa
MRKATPRGQMSGSQNSGPAVMLMPPDIRSTFMPNPPLEPIPSVQYRRKKKWTGVANYMTHLLEETKLLPPDRIRLPTPQSIQEQRKQLKQEQYRKSLQPYIMQFRNEQKECGGEYKNMNCYNTLFIGRLAYEVTERKLLREMEVFGPIKDIHIIKRYDANSSTNSSSNNNNNSSANVLSRGYAFVEYEHEEDMKRAYRAMDGTKIEGREIVVDVERGHTVPDFLPRRLGGGLGGTRLGSKEMNVTRPGRFDPQRQLLFDHPHLQAPPFPPVAPSMSAGGGMGRGMGGGPPPPYGSGNHFGGPSPPIASTPYGMSRGGSDRYGGIPPPREWDRGRGSVGGSSSSRGDDYDRNKRRRSRSPPDQRYGGGGGGNRRPRY